jgi:structure-specific recognition protein 1
VGEDLEETEEICFFPDMRWVIPSGKFEVRFLPRCFVLRGKSTDMSVRYNTVHRLFLLPTLREEISLVFQLSTPLRQGSAAHHFLNLQMDMKQRPPPGFKLSNLADEMLVQNALTPNDCAQLQLPTLMSRLLKMLTGIEPSIPLISFKSSNGLHSVNCSFKHNAGQLFPLKKGLVFLHKPCIFIPYDQIKCVQVQRGSQGTAGNRYFDLAVVVDEGRTLLDFQHVDRGDLKPLMSTLGARGVSVPEIKDVVLL